MKHKTIPYETFKINCFLDSYSTEYTKEELENEITIRLNQSIGLKKEISKANWNIEIHII